MGTVKGETKNVFKDEQVLWLWKEFICLATNVPGSFPF